MTDPANRPQPGLGSRPEHAPEILAPPPTAPPPLDPRPWTAVPDEVPAATNRGPIVLMAVFGAVILAVVGILGMWLVNGGNPREPGDPLGEDPPVAVPPPPFEERLHADEIYGGDWRLELDGDVSTAAFVKSWDHDDCSSSALFSGDSDELVELGCQYRIEGAYRSKDGHTLLAEQVLVFGDAAAAEEAAFRLDWTSYAFQPEGTSVDAQMSGGSVDSNKQYLIVTTAAIDTADEATVSAAEELLNYFHADHVAVFHWR